ncbi:hypothetical protein ACOACO_11620 [Nocardioides sp. CPCC 205120]|uniref:hypothetical protein n=1 Tax=Nocardioides sp. CPCC 205120 TaxID=3406462 RepID=UPI003B500B01
MTDDDARLLAELDRLDAAVRTAPAGDTTAQIALWQHVTRLPQWFFIARGSAEQPRPYGVAFDQGPVVCLYSSAARARDAARALGLADAATDVPVYGVPLPAAIDYVAAFEQAGVFGVAVDHPLLGHWIPLANLGVLKRWLGGSAG